MCAVQAGRCPPRASPGAALALQAGPAPRLTLGTAAFAARAALQLHGAALNAHRAQMAHMPTPGARPTATIASLAPTLPAWCVPPLFSSLTRSAILDVRGSKYCVRVCGSVTHGERLQGSKLCMMCPANMTNLEDGSHDCPVLVLPGTNLAARYAVIVSFGIYLNGTSLEEVAQKVKLV